MPDPILLWNEVALEANRVSHTNGQGEQAGPPLSARALAIVHLAMYDAFAAVHDTPAELPPYQTDLPSPPAGATFDQVVAGAAYETLSALFPSQRPYFESILSIAGDAASNGHKFGTVVGRAILALRAGDPGVGSAAYRPPTGR